MGTLLLSYGTLSSYIALNYTIIFDNRIPWDAYFSFDNRSIVLTGGGFERHPLANYYFDVIRSIAAYFSGGKFDSTFRLTLAILSSITISLSAVHILKYLKNVIHLNVAISLLLVFFFSISSTAIILSFTPETYTYSLFFLCAMTYYSAIKIKTGAKIGVLPLTVGTSLIGGLTITNAVKVFIPVFFENGLVRSWKNFFNAILRMGVAVFVFLGLYLARLDFNWQRIFSKTSEQYDKFSQPKVTPIWDMIYSWFFGGNLLFPSFLTRDYHNKKGFEYKALFMDVYSSPVSYFVIGTLLFFILWSVLRNYKNKLVLILVISFLVDIIIHCVLKFGLHTSYIYGGHFVFVYPLLIGWLIKSYDAHRRWLISLSCILIILSVFFALNNFYRMEEFFQFLETYYVNNK